jgi:hypothetical protein
VAHPLFFLYVTQSESQRSKASYANRHWTRFVARPTESRFCLWSNSDRQYDWWGYAKQKWEDFFFSLMYNKKIIAQLDVANNSATISSLRFPFAQTNGVFFSFVFGLFRYRVGTIGCINSTGLVDHHARSP